MQTDDLQDPLTGVWSRFGLMFFAEHYIKLLRRVKREAILFVVAVDGLPAEGPYGAAQEENLKETARLLRRTFRTSDAVARVRPDVFAVLLLETSELAAEVLLRRLEDRLGEWKQEHRGAPPLTLTLIADRVRPDLEMAFLDALTRIEAALRKRQTAKMESPGSAPLSDDWSCQPTP